MSPKYSLLFCAFYIFFFCFPSFGKVVQTTDDADALGSRYEDNDEDNGGPSKKFRPMGYDWAMELRKNLQRRGHYTKCIQRKRSSTKTGITKEELCKEEKKFFAQLPEVMKEYEKVLLNALNKANLQGIVSGRIKSIDSLVEKMKQDKIDDVRDITDIVGLRVTLQTMSDIQAFKKSLLHHYNDNVTEIRCYGTCGPNVGVEDEREQRYWPWKGSGYRRLHFKVSVPSLETKAEIQVGTPYMTLWAEWEHAVVYKGPENIKNDDKVRSYAQDLAQYYMMLDNTRDGLNPLCPESLMNTRGEDIFSPDDWKIFGNPNNGCNFWNDLRVDMPN